MGSSNVSPELTNLYRRVLKRVHPDLAVDEQDRLRCEELTKRANAAYARGDEAGLRAVMAPGPGEVTTPEWERQKPQREQEEGKGDASVGSSEEWVAASPTYDHASSSDFEGPLAWRYIKVFLRTIWRLFKMSAVLAMGVLLLIGIVAQLATYWSNEVKREQGQFHAEIKSWKTDFYLSNLLGIPLAAVRGLILLSSTLLLILIFTGSMIWETIQNHQVLAVTVMGLVFLSFAAWASLTEYQSEFAPSISSKPPSASSWVMGLVVLLGTVWGCFYLIPPFHAAAPDVVTNQQPEQQTQAPVMASAPIEPKDLWRPAGAVKHLFIGDFRDGLHDNQITDAETLQKLRAAIEPSVTGNIDDFFFYGPLSGNFIGGADDSHQLLYTAVLNWVAAGRSHADGDLVFAVVMGSEGSQIFELDGGGVAIGALRLPGAKQDLIISMPEWSGQGETMIGLAIFALSKERAEKLAGISTVYDDNCAADSSQPLVVADRIYADVDLTGGFSFRDKEHWSSSCSSRTPLTLVSKGTETAEDVLVRLHTAGGVLSEQPGIATSQVENPTVLDALNEWQQATLSNDPDRQIMGYAQHLDRYYLRSDVDRSFVLSDLMAQHDQGSSVSRLNIDQVKTAAESDAVADVDFMESVSFIRHGLPQDVTVHTFLKFIKVEGKWKIFFVRQLNT